jgi:hypothetical protein
MPFEAYTAQPFFAKLPAAYHIMLDACRAWAQGRYAGLAGRAFDGTALRPRRDLLLWAQGELERHQEDAQQRQPEAL